MSDFFIERRIYYHHTDAGGVMYYGNYFSLLEEGRVEFLRSRGVSTGEYAVKGIVFPVVSVDIKYKSPARYGDIVKIFTKVDKIGNSSMHFAQEIKRDDKLLVEAKTVWVCIGPDFKTVPVPAAIKKAIL